MKTAATVRSFLIVFAISLRTITAHCAEVLTNAAQLRALTAAEAAARLPVQIRATVTATNPGTAFVQDETGGTFVHQPPTNLVLQIGDVIEANGASYPGRFLAGLTEAHCRVIGHGELPKAISVSFDDLLMALRHYERVEVKGIVRSVAISTEPNRFVLSLSMGAGKLEVQIATENATNPPPLVDARVRIVGLAAGYINNRRQLLAPQLFVNSLDDVTIETPPSLDPFDVPLATATTLLNFNPDGVTRHRVRVRGVVTHREPGAVFLRDNGLGLLVETAQLDSVKPGDEVEAAGFPEMGRFSAFLDDAVFRVIGHGPKPQPIATTLSEALTGTNDANLITLNAEIIEVLEEPEETSLLLRADNSAFRARVPQAHPGSLRKGSSVSLVGVCRVEEFNPAGSGFGANPRSIELLLHSPNDVTILSTPSKWTTQRLAIAAGVLLGVALLASCWVALLRRRVAEQARIIHEKVQRQAALEERHRMAREMHDTLAQSFSGLGYQLDALTAQIPADAGAARAKLETARQMVRYGQENFRRSLMNLRAQELESGSLTDALTELASHITNGTGIEMNCKFDSMPDGLPEIVETNLLRIAQECLTNAVHHGKPRRIDLTLQRESNELRLSIVDNGVGFDSASLQHSRNGHFGWRGIHERAEQIRATLNLSAQPGRGTSVTVSIPI